MPVVYRLIKTRYAEHAFDGYGAKKFGGRWNSKGALACYASDSVALAVLEVLVHTKDAATLHHYSLCSLTIPERLVEVLADDALPIEWQADPAPLSTAAIGDEWLSTKQAIALAVPSTIVPMQKNFLLNPAHPGFDACVAKEKRCKPFRFDARLLRQRGAA